MFSTENLISELGFKELCSVMKPTLLVIYLYLLTKSDGGSREIEVNCEDIINVIKLNRSTVMDSLKKLHELRAIDKRRTSYGFRIILLPIREWRLTR